MTKNTQKIVFYKLLAISGSLFKYDPSSLYWVKNSQVLHYFLDAYRLIFHIYTDFKKNKSV